MNNWLAIGTSLILLSGLAFLALACSSEPLTEEQVYERTEDRERWRICEMLYEQAGVSTYHEHSHSVHDNDFEIKEDLHLNDCRRILRRAGLWQ